MHPTSSIVDPAGSAFVVGMAELPGAIVIAIGVVFTDVDIKLDWSDRIAVKDRSGIAHVNAEEVFDDTFSTSVEAWGTVGEVRVIKRVMSFSNRDRRVDIDPRQSARVIIADHPKDSSVPGHHSFGP